MVIRRYHAAVTSGDVGQDGDSPTPKRRSDRVIGPFDALHIITEGNPDKAEAALERLVESDEVERAILVELASPAVIADPDAFPAAHHAFARGLEIYDRNSRLLPTKLPTGFLRPLVTPLVGLLARSIARRHQRRIVLEVLRLYMLREAASTIDSPEHQMLRPARKQVQRLTPELSTTGFVIPAFLVGGAALSAVASFLADLLHTGQGRIAVLAVTLVLTVGVFWCVLMAAAVTRRRTRLAIDQPLRTLWDTLGGAGRPPRDPTRLFVAGATTFLILGWVLAPLLTAILSGIW